MAAVDFDPFSRDFFDDPSETYRRLRLREEAPCFYSERYDFYALSRFDDVVAGDAALTGAVEETVRYWAPSQYQGRFSLAESTWRGVTIPAGKPVFLLTGAANHDLRAVGDPDAFDIESVQMSNVAGYSKIPVVAG